MQKKLSGEQTWKKERVPCSAIHYFEKIGTLPSKCRNLPRFFDKIIFFSTFFEENANFNRKYGGV